MQTRIHVVKDFFLIAYVISRATLNNLKIRSTGDAISSKLLAFNTSKISVKVIVPINT
jgi:hypothetical protein